LALGLSNLLAAGCGLRLLPLPLLPDLISSAQRHRGLIPSHIGRKPVLNHLTKWDHVCPTALHMERVSGLVQWAAMRHVGRILHPSIKVVLGPFFRFTGWRNRVRVLVLPLGHDNVISPTLWLRRRGRCRGRDWRFCFRYGTGRSGRWSPASGRTKKIGGLSTKINSTGRRNTLALEIAYTRLTGGNILTSILGLLLRLLALIGRLVLGSLIIERASGAGVSGWTRSNLGLNRYSSTLVTNEGLGFRIVRGVGDELLLGLITRGFGLDLGANRRIKRALHQSLWQTRDGSSDSAIIGWVKFDR
jgi:hypothetical protein